MNQVTLFISQLLDLLQLEMMRKLNKEKDKFLEWKETPEIQKIRNVLLATWWNELQIEEMIIIFFLLIYQNNSLKIHQEMMRLDIAVGFH